MTARKRQPSTTREAGYGILSDEVMGLCPLCKAFETLWFTHGRLVQTRKFIQHGGQVYHDCGSDQPCSLYRIF
jgi:hypothetical protein